MQAHAHVLACSPGTLHRAFPGFHRASQSLKLVSQPHLARQQPRRQARWVTRMGLKAVESFDGSFTLDTVALEILYKLLQSEVFRQQVAQQCNLPQGTRVEFTELLFQPVPWSPTTKKGMPAEFEKYQEDPGYTIVNVPPNYMFQVGKAEGMGN